MESNSKILFKEKEGSKTLNKKKIEKILRSLLIELGENPDREGLIGTPARMVEAFEEIFSGYTMSSGLDVSFTEETDAIIAKDIQFYSMCEHHMLPFYGKVHIAYLPDGKVFGISKLTRLVEKYSRRMQIQERLTRQIAEEITKMGVRGVIVIAEGEHLCMKMRGVRNHSLVVTMAHRGLMEQKELRENILALISNSKPGLNSF
ncbi:MAG TPA: GTP cyclohydrolase I FolE [Nitrososphaeraceae archaeon]|nr:GTP cyclohydrolase I FolE [Nitrososphaeraceae archaeon]